MSYVLVALHDEKDEATRLTLGLAHHIASKKPPDQSFEGVHPPHEDVSQAFASLRSTVPSTIPTGLVFGHCGKRVRALHALRGSSEHWATPEEFGAMFEGTRVYVFACETIRNPRDIEEFGVESFGELAVGYGVDVFVGHYIEVGVPEPPPHWSDEQKKLLQDVTSSVFLAFLDGEDREKALKRAVLDAAAEEFLVSDSGEDIFGGEENATGWGAALLLQKLRKSLVVLKRT